MKIALSTIESTRHGKSEVIHLFGRDTEGYQHHIPVYNFKPYFYLDKIEPVKKNKNILSIESDLGLKSINHNPMKKITMQNKSAIIGGFDSSLGIIGPGYAQKYPTSYESDIPLTSQFILETGIKSGFEYSPDELKNTIDSIHACEFKGDLRRLHIDIETSTDDSGGKFPSIKNPVNRIFCITVFDVYTKIFTVFIFHPKYQTSVTKQTYYNPIEKALKIRLIQLDAKLKVNKMQRDLFNITLIRNRDDINHDMTASEFEYYSLLDEIKDLPDQIQQIKIKLKNNDKNFKKEYPAVIKTFHTEPEMLRDFIEYCKKYRFDIHSGWNLKEFDEPYIIARCKHLNIKEIRELSALKQLWIDDKGVAHVKGLIVFDTMEGLKKMQTHKLPSYRLDAIAKKCFEIGKIGHKGFDWEYENRTNRLIKYNIQDVFLDYAIGVDQKIFQFFYDIKCYVGCSYEDVLSNSRIIDMYLLFKARDQQIVLPSKVQRPKGKKSRGAIVFEPPDAGLFFWISVYDFKSLYPNCIRTLNMGADTIVRNPKPEQIPTLIKSTIEGVYFRKDKKSFLVSIIAELLDYRQEMKDLMKKYKDEGDEANEELYDRIQTVVKFILNSLFGVLGFNTFRLYDKDIFDNVISLAREVITYSNNVCKKLGYTLHYGDTDSIFMRMHGNTVEEVMNESYKLADIMNESYNTLMPDYNIDEHTLLIKIDEVFKTILMVEKSKGVVAKKRYAGVMSDNKVLIKGFDRSDMSKVGNMIMKKVLDLIIHDKLDFVLPYLKNEIKKIKNMEYKLSEIAFSQGISKKFSEYKNKSNRIRGAEWTNKHSYLWGSVCNYGAGSKPKYIFVKRMELPTNYERVDLIALDKDDYLPEVILNCIDWDTHLEKTIKDKIDSILMAVNIDWDEVMGKYSILRLGQY